MKSGLFLLCLGMLVPVQIIAIGMIIRTGIWIQSRQPKTNWLLVTNMSVLTFSMAALPITLAVIIFTKGK